jgi:hypothetical protein
VGFVESDLSDGRLCSFCFPSIEETGRVAPVVAEVLRKPLFGDAACGSGVAGASVPFGPPAKKLCSHRRCGSVAVSPPTSDTDTPICSRPKPRPQEVVFFGAGPRGHLLVRKTNDVFRRRRETS